MSIGSVGPSTGHIRVSKFPSPSLWNRTHTKSCLFVECMVWPLTAFSCLLAVTRGVDCPVPQLAQHFVPVTQVCVQRLLQEGVVSPRSRVLYWPSSSYSPLSADPDHRESTQFLPVLTPDGSWLIGPAGTPRARVMALNHMVPPFQNCPSGQQSPVCEGSVGLCKSPCLSWFWPDFSTGWPVLFKNWPGYFKTLFLQREKFLDLWQGKKVLIIIEMTNN